MKGKPRSSGNGIGKARSKRAPGTTAKLQSEHRHQLPLPTEALQQRPFIFDSQSQTLVAPWGRTHSTFATETMLTAMIRVLVENGSPHGVYWVHPDRPPTRVEAEDVHRWLMHWCRDRACYRLDPTSPEPR